jgi:hypothetical protein
MEKTGPRESQGYWWFGYRMRSCGMGKTEKENDKSKDVFPQ